MSVARRVARLESGPLGAERREAEEFGARMTARGRELQRLRAAGRGRPYDAMSDVDLVAEMVGRPPERAHFEEVARRYNEPNDDPQRTLLRATVDYALKKAGEA